MHLVEWFSLDCERIPSSQCLIVSNSLVTISQSGENNFMNSNTLFTSCIVFYCSTNTIL